MKASPSNPDPHDPQWDKNDPLWRLLGESPRPQPNAWFTVRTLARCREVSVAAEAKALESLSSLWRWVIGGGLSVCLAMFLMVPQLNSSRTDSANTQAKVQQAFTVMASLDTSDSDSDSDSDSSTTTSWQDSTSP